MKIYTKIFHHQNNFQQKERPKIPNPKYPIPPAKCQFNQINVYKRKIKLKLFVMYNNDEVPESAEKAPYSNQ